MEYNIISICGSFVYVAEKGKACSERGTRQITFGFNRNELEIYWTRIS